MNTITFPWQDEDGNDILIEVPINDALAVLLQRCFALLQDAPVDLKDIVDAAERVFS